MGDQSHSKSHIIRVTAEPGICGFLCIVEAEKKGRHTVSVRISGSECKHIRRLAEQIKEIRMKDLFASVRVNPVFVFAQQAGCHPSCAIPVAVLKAVEVAMDMALPRDVVIRFGQEGLENSHGSRKGRPIQK